MAQCRKLLAKSFKRILQFAIINITKMKHVYLNP